MFEIALLLPRFTTVLALEYQRRWLAAVFAPIAAPMPRPAAIQPAPARFVGVIFVCDICERELRMPDADYEGARKTAGLLGWKFRLSRQVPRVNTVFCPGCAHLSSEPPTGRGQIANAVLSPPSGEQSKESA
jgi:hypothetical protein